VQPQLPAGATQAPAIVHEVLRSPGAPLDAPTRDFMEPRFGRDFGDVRVHADARAAESARALEALAYTVGRNVVFAAGHYAPQSAAGRQLLAHELSHVVQQRGSGSSETIRRHLVFGSGFKQPSLMVEAGRLQRGTWHPSSLDYKATAENSGGGEGAASFKQLLKLIEKKSPGEIKQLGLIGHGNQNGFGFSGDVVDGDVNIEFKDALTIDALTKNRDDILRLRNRFASYEEGGKITLYACEVGLNSELLLALSEAFGHVAVAAFTVDLQWCVKNDLVPRRGRVQPDHGDLAGIDCKDFPIDVRTLNEDVDALYFPELYEQDDPAGGWPGKEWLPPPYFDDGTGLADQKNVNDG